MSAGRGAGRRTLAGIGFLVLAMGLLPLADGIAKYLSAGYPVLIIVWGRFSAHLLCALPLAIWRDGPRALWPTRPGLHVLRGVFLLGSSLSFFSAISLMPLADALALMFVYPFVVTLLAPLALGEQVGTRRWIAVVVGFLGVLVVVKPGSGIYGAGTPLALGAGAQFACYIIATRKLAGGAPPAVALSFAAAVGAVIMNGALPWFWVPLDLRAVLLLGLLGLLYAIGHALIMEAFERAAAAVLAPLGYTEIVGAALVGLVLFGDFPDPSTWSGIVVIVASGVYIAVREGRGDQALAGSAGTTG